MNLSLTTARPIDGVLPSTLRSWDTTDEQEQLTADRTVVEIHLDPSHRFQVIDGLAGSFSELGALALESLAPAQRAEADAALFGRDGCGLSWGRVPVGASDFATSVYSAADTPDDWDLAAFSTQRDDVCLRPWVRRSKAVAPHLRLHASPWSPPGWLKDNGRMDQGGSLRSDPRVLPTYARYLARWCADWGAAGVPIQRLLLQNEPDSGAPFPSCVMPPEQLGRLAIALAELLPVGTETWAGTFRSMTCLWAPRFFADPAFRAAVRGAGFQYHQADHLNDFSRLHPTVPMMHTESACFDGSNTWAQAAMLFNDLVAVLHAGCGMYTYWNMVLDGTAKSTWGWKQNSLLTIRDGQVNRNPDAEVLRLVSPALQPGGVRVESFAYARRTVAIQAADGRIHVLVANPERRVVPAVMHCAGATHRTELPPSSMCCLTLGNE